VVAVEPYRVRNISGGDTSGKHRLECIGPGKKIVTVIIDSGLRYLNGDLYS
jgi:cysteine synthase A